MKGIESICLLGFGEVGSTLAAALNDKGVRISCFDTAFTNTDSAASRNRRNFSSIFAASSTVEAVAEADLIISAVTAEQDLNAARSVTPAIKARAWFLDLNSVAPKTKQTVASVIEDAGGRYVEAAIMSPIQPKGIASPILLGGPRGQEFLAIGQALGFSGASFFSTELGKTAASKMCRSVIIKGMESLLTESLLAARYYGVEDEVISSLNNLMPGVDWREHSAYMISRSLEHGIRRAEEMREVTLAVKDADLPGAMSAACAQTQDWTAQFKHRVNQRGLTALLDQIREHL